MLLALPGIVAVAESARNLCTPTRIRAFKCVTDDEQPGVARHDKIAGGIELMNALLPLLAMATSRLSDATCGAGDCCRQR